MQLFPAGLWRCTVEGAWYELASTCVTVVHDHMIVQPYTVHFVCRPTQLSLRPSTLHNAGCPTLAPVPVYVPVCVHVLTSSNFVGRLRQRSLEATAPCSGVGQAREGWHCEWSCAPGPKAPIQCGSPHKGEEDPIVHMLSSQTPVKAIQVCSQGRAIGIVFWAYFIYLVTLLVINATYVARWGVRCILLCLHQSMSPFEWCGRQANASDWTCCNSLIFLAVALFYHVSHAWMSVGKGRLSQTKLLS